MTNKKLFYLLLVIIILAAGFYAFKKYESQKLYGTFVKMEIVCDDVFGQNAFSLAEEIIKTDCENACSKIKMNFQEYDCPVGKNLVCNCR